MNGIHDMGGIQGLGAIVHEENEPVFHARWEARAFALLFALGAFRKWTLDGFRHQIEQIPPADYLRMPYYAKWIEALDGLMVKSGMVTHAELESGKAAAGSAKATPAMTLETVPTVVQKGGPTNRDVAATAHFAAGARVRARNINPAGHTRLPRYARGKIGTVERDYGVFVFPDTNAHALGEKPQHLYSVRFAAQELWGDDAPSRDTVFVDLWDDDLEPA